ncbi:MFS general substrate transporter [Meredithblackwellia eburnea MCA 4105]
MSKASDSVDHIEVNGSAPPQRIVSLAAHAGQDPEVEPELTLKAIGATAAACISYAVTVYTIAVPASVLADIGNSIGGYANRAWVVQVIGIVTAVLAPPLGLSSDYFGRRNILLVSMVLGLAGALISGQATSMPMLIAGRTVGALGNGAQGISLTIPSEVLPHRMRPQGQAVSNIFAGLTNIGGLLAAGAFVKYNVGGVGQGWRYVFHVEAILWGLIFVLLFLAYHPPPRDVASVKETTFWEKVHKVDVLGSVLLCLFVVPFLVGVSWIQSPYSASDVHVVAPLVIGLFFLLAFIGYEWKGRSDGLLHHELFSRDRNFALSILAIFAEGTFFFSYNLFYPIATSIFWEHDALLTNVRLSIIFLCFFVGAPIGAWYTSKFKEIRGAPAAGFVLIIVAIGLLPQGADCISLFLVGLATSTPSQKKVSIAWAILFGLGFSQPITLVTAVAQFSAPASLMATSTGVFISVRAIGGTSGSVVALAVFASSMAKQLPSRVAGAALSLGASPANLATIIPAAASFNATALAETPGIAPAEIPQFVAACINAVLQAYSHSFHLAWWTVFPFVVLALIAVLCFKGISSQMNYLVDAPLEELHAKHERKRDLAV